MWCSFCVGLFVLVAIIAGVSREEKMRFFKVEFVGRKN